VVALQQVLQHLTATLNELCIADFVAIVNKV